MAKSKPGAKLGEDIVADLESQIVDDPEPVATTPSGLIIPNEPGPDLPGMPVHAAAPHAPGPQMVPNFVTLEPPQIYLYLTEDGSRVLSTEPGPPPPRRFTSLDSLNYEHVSEDPATGEWVYRHMR